MRALRDEGRSRGVGAVAKPAAGRPENSEGALRRPHWQADLQVLANCADAVLVVDRVDLGRTLQRLRPRAVLRPVLVIDHWTTKARQLLIGRDRRIAPRSDHARPNDLVLVTRLVEGSVSIELRSRPCRCGSGYRCTSRRRAGTERRDRICRGVGDRECRRIAAREIVSARHSVSFSAEWIFDDLKGGDDWRCRRHFHLHLDLIIEIARSVAPAVANVERLVHLGHAALI